MYRYMYRTTSSCCRTFILGLRLDFSPETMPTVNKLRKGRLGVTNRHSSLAQLDLVSYIQSTGIGTSTILR